MKALQDWFRHHGDELYEQLKHASYTFAWLVNTIENRPPPRSDPQAEHTVEILAKAHHMLRRRTSVRAPADCRRLPRVTRSYQPIKAENSNR